MLYTERILLYCTRIYIANKKTNNKYKYWKQTSRSYTV